ncbi:helix-turn-helix domain-containing protein [Verrucosispora sp. FIM060022]|uniref:helix-turn-helix domain-containing protein n=1 Tax=Verrucosispora sp. FIM060022 TaxID=1479020 RepID=UPI000F8689F4|nr:helix-turn-helix domain-containing protein [Verrucosispora sp. FIM060022]
MRYPAGGGMNAAARVRREKVRIQAASMFEESISTTQIASELRVSEKSVREWRRRWVAGRSTAGRSCPGRTGRIRDLHLGCARSFSRTTVVTSGVTVS